VNTFRLEKVFNVPYVQCEGVMGIDKDIHEFIALISEKLKREEYSRLKTEE